MNERDLSGGDYIKVLLVVVLWGLNFAAIKIGLSGFPPLFLVGVRFVLVFFPACLWIRRPAIPFYYLLSYGFFMGIAQFGLLFTAIGMGMPAGIASVLLQAQVVFALPLAVWLLDETITPIQIAGIVISVFGVLFLGGLFHRDTALPLVPFLLVLMAAFFFGAANVFYRVIANYNTRQGQRTSALEIMVWSALYVPIPMFLLSLVMETPEAVAAAVRTLQPAALISLGYMVVFSTFAAYGLWTSLIGKYSSSKISPFSLLVPLVGVLASVVLLNETISGRQIIGIVITIAGLVFANAGTLILKKLKARIPMGS